MAFSSFQSIISLNEKSNGTNDFSNCKWPSDQDLIFNESSLNQDSVFNKNPKTNHVIYLEYNLYNINGFVFILIKYNLNH